MRPGALYNAALLAIVAACMAVAASDGYREIGPYLVPAAASAASAAPQPEEPPATPQPQPEEPPAQPQPRIVATDAEIDLMACIVWLEARGEPYEGQTAVAEVIVNRVLDRRFPGSVEGVLSDKKYGTQFSTWRLVRGAEPVETQYDAVYDALYGTPTLPPETVYFSRRAQTETITARIGNHVFCA
jgi:spore germination cell wall hydrolase CwlJ-like protein